MPEQHEGATPYSAPQSRLTDGPKLPGRVGFGYFVIMLLNTPGLYMAYLLFGAIGDSYGPLAAMLAGVPSFAGQGLLGLLPACVYYNQQVGRVPRKPLVVLLTQAIVVTFLLGIATVLAFAMPRTHGSGC
jgi:hypothetical protein